MNFAAALTEMTAVCPEGVFDVSGISACLCIFNVESVSSVPECVTISHQAGNETDSKTFILASNDNYLIEEDEKTLGRVFTVACRKYREASFTLVVELFRNVCRLVWRMFACGGTRCRGVFASGRNIGIFERQFII